MAAAGPATNEEIASQLMMPQGIDLSSLGNLAAVLGVSQGLNLLVDKQQGIIMRCETILGCNSLTYQQTLHRGREVEQNLLVLNVLQHNRTEAFRQSLQLSKLAEVLSCPLPYLHSLALVDCPTEESSLEHSTDSGRPLPII